MFNTIILGSDVGKAKGTLRSNPGEGQHLECPCKVNLYISNLRKPHNCYIKIKKPHIDSIEPLWSVKEF